MIRRIGRVCTWKSVFLIYTLWHEVEYQRKALRRKIMFVIVRCILGIREHDGDIISNILDGEIWGEVPRVTEQNNLVVIPIRDLRYSDFVCTQPDIKSFSKSEKCNIISAKIDFSQSVGNLCGWVGSIPFDIIAFAYYPYVASNRLCYWRHINISWFQRGSKDGKGQKTN